MKENYVHITFVIDESSSMCYDRENVRNGFNTFMEEQRKEIKGDATFSLYKFNREVTNVFFMEDVKNIPNLNRDNYWPNGSTALYDAIGIAVDETGKKLASMREEDRPSKVIVVIMTDGEENSSNTYSLSRIQEMISLQEKTYSWKFVYLGAELADRKQANQLGLSNGSQAYFLKKDLSTVYKLLGSSITNYRACKNLSVADKMMESDLDAITTDYRNQTGANV